MIRAKPDVAQGKVIPHRLDDTHVEQVEGTTVRVEPDVVEWQVSPHRDEPIMPVVDNAKSTELSYLHIMKITCIFILVIFVKKWIPDIVVGQELQWIVHRIWWFL